jgi:hypothetical protein
MVAVRETVPRRQKFSREPLRNVSEEVLGGLVLTDDGLQRISIDRERVRTFVEADASR